MIFGHVLKLFVLVHQSSIEVKDRLSLDLLHHFAIQDTLLRCGGIHELSLMG
jgi:hypothetical protein